MVGFASLWILGLATILTALGFADYHAGIDRRRTRDILREPGYQTAINVGLTLFCAGLIGSSSAWWEYALWGLLGMSFGYFAWSNWRVYRAVSQKDAS